MAGLIESITLGKYLFSLPECGGRMRGRGGGVGGVKESTTKTKRQAQLPLSSEAL